MLQMLMARCAGVVLMGPDNAPKMQAASSVLIAAANLNAR